MFSHNMAKDMEKGRPYFPCPQDIGEKDGKQGKIQA
jgi:hypothetical protein